MDPRTMWGADAGELLVERAGVEPGMDVLDVACGTGNAAIPAARAGARVTGLDCSDDLLAIARERAADAMVEIDWVEGDAQELPFPDASFDRVLSTFGHMFAPDHERTAAEMRRVCRPGGCIATACWTPEGSIGRIFRPPILWGTEAHIRELLGDGEFERHEIEWEDESVESYAAFMLESLPLLNAPELVTFLAAENLNDDGTLRFRGEYLLAVVPR